MARDREPYKAVMASRESTPVCQRQVSEKGESHCELTEVF